MTKQTRKFGVEIECYGIRNLDKLAWRMALAGATKVADDLQGRSYDFSGEKIPKKWDGETKAWLYQVVDKGEWEGDQPHWTIKDDGSIEGTGRGWEAEITSPPLVGKKGLAELVGVCKAIKKEGGTVNSSCGLHVHLDASDLLVRDVELIVRRYTKWEKVIDTLVHPSRRGDQNDYCMEMLSFVESVIYENTEDDDLHESQSFNPNKLGKLLCFDPEEKAFIVPRHRRFWWEQRQVADDLRLWTCERMLKVNTQALQAHGTIEFRQHHSTLNGEDIVAWIKFLLSFVDRCRVLAEKINHKERWSDRTPFSGVPKATKSLLKARQRRTSASRRVWF